MATHAPFPFRPVLAAFALALVGHADLAAAAKTGGFSVNIPKTREAARNFYNAVYKSSNGIAMGWTGSLAGCVPGGVSSAYQAAGLTRVNYFRAMAGVPASITFLADYTRKAQQAALMMLANQSLSHAPPGNWACYTADGATAAGNSNLAAGMAGAESVDGYMNDSQVAPLGHRRWVIYPQTQNMGMGNVADSSKSPYPRASALWVFDSHMHDTRPATRDGFVAWPPKGYVPYALIYPDWSFAYPGADFSQATAILTQNGAAVPITVSKLQNGFGENALAFRPVTPLTLSGADKTYHVAVANVRVDGVAKNFAYDVRGFDPAVKTAASVTPVISGNAQPVLNQPEAYSFTLVSGADGYQRLNAPLTPFTANEGAEAGTGAFAVAANTAAYPVVATDVFATGKKSFHLAHPTPPGQQSLTWNYSFYVNNAQANLKFSSRLGWATSNQTALVQVSLDDGKNWQDIYRQAGSGGAGETGFTTRTVSLQAFAGKIVRLRFAYTLGNGGYFPQTSAGAGWYIDNIRMAQTSKLGSQTILALGRAATGFDFAPAAAGQYLLKVRATAFGGYPLEWGPGFVATVAP